MAISLLQTEEISASIAYYKALNGDPPTRRRKKNVDTDNKISMYKQMLEAEDLTFEAYFKYINGALFIAIDKKKDRPEAGVGDDDLSDDDEIFNGDGESDSEFSDEDAHVEVNAAADDGYNSNEHSRTSFASNNTTNTNNTNINNSIIISCVCQSMCATK